MPTLIMRTDDPRYVEPEPQLEGGLSYQAHTVDRLLRWAFAVRESSISGHCSLSTNPDEAHVHRLRIPEKMTEAGWVIGCAERHVRPRLKDFIFGYYSHRPSERNRLVRILAGKIIQDPTIGPDHRAWKVLHMAIMEHAHPDGAMESNPSALSERKISRETGWSRHQAVRSSSSLTALLDSWREEEEEVLMPVFRGKGWIGEDA